MAELNSLEKTTPRNQTHMEESELATSIRRKNRPDENYMMSPDARSPMMVALDPRDLGIQK